jgi:glutathione S-transferase
MSRYGKSGTVDMCPQAAPENHHTAPQASPALRLWGIGTSRTLRAHWALIALNLEYASEPIQTRTPEMETAAFRAINPAGKLPVLQDRDFILTESPAIITYLSETYGTPETALIPGDAQGRARYFEWLSFITMELDATSLYVLRRHFGLPHIYGESPVANTAARGYFDRMIKSAAKRLTDSTGLLLGPRLSGVDILMMTCLRWAVSYDVPLPAEIDAYRERVAALPSYQTAIKVNTP